MSAQKPPLATNIFGVRYSNLSFAEALARVLEHRSLVAPPSNQRHLLVAFPGLNPVFISNLQRSYRGLYDPFQIICNDGRNVARVASLLGAPLASPRIAGMDYLPSLLKAMQTTDHRLFLVCARPSTGERFEHVMKTEYGMKQDRLAGFACPPYRRQFTEEDLAEVGTAILSARPDIVVIGIASPKQECVARLLCGLLDRRGEACRPTAFLCLGGAVETTAGIIPVAPQWIRDAGLESFYRFSREPRRLFYRYLIYNWVFVYFLGRALFQRWVLGRDMRVWQHSGEASTE